MLDSSAYRKKNYEVVELSSIHTYIYVKLLKKPRVVLVFTFVCTSDNLRSAADELFDWVDQCI